MGNFLPEHNSLLCDHRPLAFTSTVTRDYKERDLCLAVFTIAYLLGYATKAIHHSIRYSLLITPLDPPTFKCADTTQWCGELRDNCQYILVITALSNVMNSRSCHRRRPCSNPRLRIAYQYRQAFGCLLSPFAFHTASLIKRYAIKSACPSYHFRLITRLLYMTSMKPTRQ